MTVKGLGSRRLLKRLTHLVIVEFDRHEFLQRNQVLLVQKILLSILVVNVGQELGILEIVRYLEGILCGQLSKGGSYGVSAP